MGESFKSKMPLHEANVLAQELKLELMRAGLEYVEVCGSVRRCKPEVGDLDMVAVGDITILKSPEHAHRWRYADGGKKKCTIEYKGRQVNIMATTFANIGAAMLYFTGNATLNLIMRRKAKKLGMKLNEYGLWKDDLLVTAHEQEIFKHLGMAYKEPNERSV